MPVQSKATKSINSPDRTAQRFTQPKRAQSKTQHLKSKANPLKHKLRKADLVAEIIRLQSNAVVPISKKQVEGVLESLEILLERLLSKDGPPVYEHLSLTTDACQTV